MDFAQTFRITSAEVNSSGNGTVPADPVPEPLTLFILIPFLLILTPTVLIGTLGNGFTIYAFLRFEFLQTSFNSYIFSLAIADIFVSGFVIPFYIVTLCFNYWPLSEWLCVTWIFVDWFVTFESVLTVAIISCERFWSVTWPISYHHQHTPKNVKIVIVVSWCFIAAIWIPAFLNDRLNHENKLEDCNWDEAANYSSGLFLGVVAYFMPFTAILLCYSSLGWKMRKRFKRVIPRPYHANQGTLYTITYNNGDSAHFRKISLEINQEKLSDFEEHAPENDRSSSYAVQIKKRKRAQQMARQSRRMAVTRDRSALVTLGAIVVAFALCWFPYYVYYFILVFNWMTPPVWFEWLTALLPYLNSAVNPVLYTLLHRDFRQKFQMMLKIGKN